MGWPRAEGPLKEVGGVCGEPGGRFQVCQDQGGAVSAGERALRGTR